MEFFFAPRVAHPYESLTIAERVDAKHRVSMHIGHTDVIRLFVRVLIASRGASSHHPALVHLDGNPVPKLLNTRRFMV